MHSLRPTVRTMLMTGALTVFGAAAAQAQGGFRSWTVCGGNHFNTCAAVNLQATLVSGNQYHVAMQVWNLSNLAPTPSSPSTVFTKIGFFNTSLSFIHIGTVAQMEGPVRQGNGGVDPAAWLLGSHNNAGGVAVELGANSGSGVGDGVANNCDPSGLPGGSNAFWLNPCANFGTLGTFGGPTGGWINISFDVLASQSWALSQSDDTGLIIQAQNGPNGASAQCITAGDQFNCAVVPEPTTLILLGTGLLGVAGLAHRRRRCEDSARS